MLPKPKLVQQVRQEAPADEDHAVDFSQEMWEKWSYVAGHRWGESWRLGLMDSLGGPDEVAFCRAAGLSLHGKSTDQLSDDTLHPFLVLLNEKVSRLKNITSPASNADNALGGEERDTEEADLRAWFAALNVEETSAAVAFAWAKKFRFPDEWQLTEEPLCEGFRGGLLAQPSRLGDSETKAVQYWLTAYARFNRKAAEHLAIGQLFLRQNAQKDDIVVVDDGSPECRDDPAECVQYEIIVKQQHGGQRRVVEQPTDLVQLHIVAAKHRGQRTIFSTRDAGQKPLVHQQSRLLPGVGIAVQRMAVGDRWRVFIPPRLGYGREFALNKRVFPNDVLVYDIELLRVLTEEEQFAEQEETLKDEL